MNNIFGKLIEAESNFKDKFEPASEDELEKRQYYDEDEIMEYLTSAPLEYLAHLYWSFIGPFQSQIAHELMAELPDEIWHKLYITKVKGRVEFEFDANEIEQWAKEIHKRKKTKQ